MRASVVFGSKKNQSLDAADGGYHAVIEREHSDVSSVVDVVSPDDGIAVVFNPDSR